MRTATVLISPPEAGLHPADAEMGAHRNIERQAIDHVTSLADGTGIALCRLRGNAAAIEEILSEADGILDYHRTVAGALVYVQVHFQPTETAKALLKLRRSHELVIQTPIRWLADGRLEVSAVGDDEALQGAIHALPDSIGAELVEIGSFDPSDERPGSLLTDRQLEVLDAALAVGYYEEPRQGTQADVAEAVGLAPATVGEHLRRIEGKVLRALRE